MRRIEELPIAPGRERAVHVSYTPQRLQTGADGAPATRLTRRVFRVDLKAFAISRQRRRVGRRRNFTFGAVPRSCMHVGRRVSPPRLGGDCNIQTHKSATALVRTLATSARDIDIDALEGDFDETHSLTIAPRSSHELKFHSFPAASTRSTASR